MARKRSKSKEGPDDLRRVPSQERSKRRLESILDAAARLFAAEGFAATTMERIAAGAGTSIGSVYQFFPNKRAVFKAVAMEAIRRSGEAFAGQLGPESFAKPWYELLDQTIDTFLALNESHPVFRAMWRNPALYEDYAAEDEAQMKDFAERLAQLLGLWLPSEPIERRRNVAATLVQSTVAMLFTAGRAGGLADPGLIRETKLMLRRYLQPMVEQQAEEE